jgi:hypothetical protein
MWVWFLVGSYLINMGKIAKNDWVAGMKSLVVKYAGRRGAAGYCERDGSCEDRGRGDVKITIPALGCRDGSGF